MKQISAHFNKKSRLTIAPELSGIKKQSLHDFNARTLPDRLTSLLTIQNDFYPCFDWNFPPPLLQKSQAAASPQELFSEPSIIPFIYTARFANRFAAFATTW